MTTTTRERFKISTQGFRELQEGRAPWTLVKELIQNVWDEAPEATRCDVTIADGTDHDHTLITVEDDGPGFTDPTHAYTLMAPTPKRLDPSKRGRFNIGEKEIISMSIWAEVETKGITIRFPKKGGRTSRPNKRLKGTVVTLLMPWDREQALDLEHMLLHFRPTDCTLNVNGKAIPPRQPLTVHSAILPSILQSAPGQPLRPTKRRTDVHILESHDPSGSWLYELGIPIQQTEIPFDVDVQQKVPMPPNRDTVGQAYLQDISAETLNAVHNIMRPESFSDTWVRTGIEDDRATPEAVITTKNNRYGVKVAMWSSDTDANMKAAENGYQILHPRSVSPQERTKLRDVGGVQSTHALFGRDHPPEEPKLPEGPLEPFAAWVKRLATLVGLEATVEYYSAPGSKVLADCTSDTKTPIVRFNTAKTDLDWFTLRGPEQLGLVIHELSHAYASTPMEHGPKWGHACAEIGGIVAHELQRKPPQEKRQ